MPNKSIFGLHENIAGALAYAGIFVTGIAVFILEKENKFVRFCALQSTVFFFAWCIVATILNTIFNFIPLIGGIGTTVVFLAGMASYLYLLFTAYRGQMFKIPVLGDIVWEQVNK